MRATTAGLALLLLLTACGGGAADPSGSAASPGTSPSASPQRPAAAGEPSSAAPPAVVPEPPDATDDRAGQVAFAEYVLQAWIYALNTNDPQPLLDVSGQEPCGGCEQLVRELEQRSEEGWYVALRGVRVSGTEVTTTKRTARTSMTLTIPESETYHDDGTYRSTNPAHPRRTFDVEMARDGDRFRLVSFSLY